MNPERKKNPAVVAIIVIVLLALAGGAVYVATRPGETTTTENATRPTTNDTSAPTESSEQVAGKYTNGKYEASGTYSTPGGRESVDLTITITDGVITATEIDGSATSGDSLQYQTRFIDNYESLVVGKSVDEVSLSRVAGSSLTSTGFNNALEQIKTDASA